MIGRKATVGMALLCALVFSAFAAQSAFAVEGTTAFTCVKQETKDGFKDAHCKEQVAPGAIGAFGHVEIKESPGVAATKTHITNAKTDAATTGSTDGVLKVTALGVKNEIVCKKILGHGDISNTKDAATNEHTIKGEKITIHYTECDVKEPAGCAIPNRTILVEGVRGDTKGQTFPNIKLEPEVGKTFVTITYEKCGLLNGAHNIEGSVRGQLRGATIEFTHATVTAEKTLTFFGTATGINGKVTVSQASATTKIGDAESGLTAGANPISATQFKT